MMIVTIDRLEKYLFQQVSIAPLVVFRILFGGLLLYSTLRTAQKGWIKELYIDPVYHFSFVDWIKPLPGDGMYFVFLGLALSALSMMLGLFYRVSSIVFCLLFTYVELIDKTYYLNHYYLVTLLTFWLAIVPAHRWYSIDTIIFPRIKSSQCMNWHILIIKIQLSIVYFFAGLAKVNPDWLFRAQPLATWLPGKYELPVLGKIMHFRWVAFMFSWMGCIYDLTIWMLLWFKRTRGIAYLFVLIFHFLTAVLFPRIGMFPLIMVISTIIFFSPEWHERLLRLLPFSKKLEQVNKAIGRKSRILTMGLLAYLVIQLFLPFRYLQYGGNLFWHEKGYRFSWRVMLMEKNGYTTFVVRDPKVGVQKEAEQCDYLTAFQEQQLRSQPDMILQFAHHLGKEFEQQHGYAPEVYVKSRLSLNGRRSRPFVNESTDLYAESRARNKYNWIIPLE